MLSIRSRSASLACVSPSLFVKLLEDRAGDLASLMCIFCASIEVVQATVPFGQSIAKARCSIFARCMELRIQVNCRFLLWSGLVGCLGSPRELSPLRRPP
eukprot:9959227-Alexandrium_andersonii.AAC.1